MATSRSSTRTARQRVVIGLGIAAVIGCLAAAAFVGYESWKLDQVAREDVALADAGDNEPQNWLIVGSDSREVIARNDPNAAVFSGDGSDPGGQRSDTIMVVRIDPAATQLQILSLQRDLWVPIARAGEKERINAAYSYPDGPQRLIDTIHDTLGIEINRYAEINFASFQGLVDAVGGVPMYFDKRLWDENSGLFIDKTGCQTLGGQQALAFARSRHLRYSDGVHWVDDPSGDLGRISRQQYFMRRMFDRVASKAFSSPQTFHELVDVGTRNVKLDRELDTTKAIAMAQRFAQFNGDSIKTYSLPTSPWTTPGGASVLLLDEQGAQPILNRFRGLPAASTEPADITIAVENGNGDANQASEVGKAYQVLGYKVAGVTNRTEAVEHTQVRYAPGSLRLADQIERHLTTPGELVRDTSYPAGRVVVVTGRDFTTVMRQPRPPDPAVADQDDPTTTTTAAPATTAARATSRKGAGTSSTTTEPHAANNDGAPTVGVVPGQPPPGVTCGD